MSEDKNTRTLIVVGDGMAGSPGIAARFFSNLGRAGVNVRAIAQGSSERNISAVVDSDDVTRALRAVHSGFYLSQKTLSVGIVGPGTVGGVLLQQIEKQAEDGVDFITVHCGLTRAALGGEPETLVDHYDGKRLNSPSSTTVVASQQLSAPPSSWILASTTLSSSKTRDASVEG